MPNEKIGIKSNGIISVHMPDTTGNYATLCGLDGDDPNPSVDQKVVKIGTRARIDCHNCFATWQVCRGYRAQDFAADRSQEDGKQ